MHPSIHPYIHPPITPSSIDTLMKCVTCFFVEKRVVINVNAECQHSGNNGPKLKSVVHAPPTLSAPHAFEAVEEEKARADQVHVEDASHKPTPSHSTLSRPLRRRRSAPTKCTLRSGASTRRRRSASRRRSPSGASSSLTRSTSGTQQCTTALCPGRRDLSVGTWVWGHGFASAAVSAN
eukprot:219892-Chlamydomonas_euryale.AAC.2